MHKMWDPIKFGQQLRELRESLGWSQAELVVKTFGEQIWKSSKERIFDAVWLAEIESGNCEGVSVALIGHLAQALGAKWNGKKFEVLLPEHVVNVTINATLRVRASSQEEAVKIVKDWPEFMISDYLEEKTWNIY